MDSSTRWTAIAGVLGLCTAYALSGGGASSDAPKVPPAAAPKTPAISQPQPKDEPHVAPKVPMPSSAKSVLKAAPLKLDFGEVLVNESKRQDVTFENPGTKPITITNIRGNCGCVKLEMPEKTIAPGKSEALQVTFIGQAGRRPEAYTVTLTTDEDDEPNVAVAIHGKVKQVFFVEPLTLYFDKVPKNHSKTMEATIKHADGQPFVLKTVAASRKEFSFKWEPLPDGGYKIFATVTGLQMGAVTEGAAIITDHPKVPALPLHLSAVITGDVVSLTPVLMAKQGQDNIVAPYETVIRRLTPGELTIDKVTEAEGLAVTADLNRVDATTFKVTIRFTAPFTRNPPLGEFLVQTNVEKEPLRVPYRVIRPGPKIEFDPRKPGQK